MLSRHDDAKTMLDLGIAILERLSGLPDVSEVDRVRALTGLLDLSGLASRRHAIPVLASAAAHADDNAAVDAAGALITHGSPEDRDLGSHLAVTRLKADPTTRARHLFARLVLHAGSGRQRDMVTRVLTNDASLDLALAALFSGSDHEPALSIGVDALLGAMNDTSRSVTDRVEAARVLGARKCGPADYLRTVAENLDADPLDRLSAIDGLLELDVPDVGATLDTLHYCAEEWSASDPETFLLAAETLLARGDTRRATDLLNRVAGNPRHDPGVRVRSARLSFEHDHGHRPVVEELIEPFLDDRSVDTVDLVNAGELLLRSASSRLRVRATTTLLEVMGNRGEDVTDSFFAATGLLRWAHDDVRRQAIRWLTHLATTYPPRGLWVAETFLGTRLAPPAFWRRM